jgi:cytoskeletal protein RodZ
MLLLLSPLSLFAHATAKAQEPAPDTQPQVSTDSQAAEIIDATTMGEEIFPGTDAISAEEMTAPSDPYTKTRQNPDGTFTQEIYADPINWQDQDGSWREIDSSLVPEDVDGYDLANASNSFKFRLAQKSGSGKTCSLEIGDKKARLHLAGHAKKEYKKDDDKDQGVKEGKPETGEDTPATEAPPSLNCVSEGNQAYYYDSKKGYSLEFTL